MASTYSAAGAALARRGGGLAGRRVVRRAISSSSPSSSSIVGRRRLLSSAAAPAASSTLTNALVERQRRTAAIPSIGAGAGAGARRTLSTGSGDFRGSSGPPRRHFSAAVAVAEELDETLVEKDDSISGDGAAAAADGDGAEEGLLQIMTEDEFEPDAVIRDVRRAMAWNQRGPAAAADDDADDGNADDEDGANNEMDDRVVEEEEAPEDTAEERDAMMIDDDEIVKGGQEWDPVFARLAADNYERHLRYILHKLQQQTKDDDASADDALAAVHPSPLLQSSTSHLLSASVTAAAFKSLLRSNLHTSHLSSRVRTWERLVGQIGLTPLTDHLSYRLLEANAKGGNVGRTLSLLNLRGAREYEPREAEFVMAVRSIQSAGLALRTSRNIFLGEKGENKDVTMAMDNPTRWLDAILLNMSGRGHVLSIGVANRMLNCYASTGRTGRATHFFYRVARSPIEDDDENGSAVDDYNGGEQKFKVRMKMRPPPPFHKVPSEVGDMLVDHRSSSKNNKGAADGSTATAVQKDPRYQDKIYTAASETVGQGGDGAGDSDPGGAAATATATTTSKSVLEWESTPAWSPPLTAAFAFAESLSHGACGHPPLTLDVISYNTLLKVCCYRGALHRALKLLGEGMAQRNVETNTRSYNVVLSGLARVGDVRKCRELLVELTNKGLVVDSYTVMALVDAYLNAGDVPSAVSLIQDLFNQHDVLPPHTSHLKIFEHALGLDLPYEARRHLYFLKQLRNWEAPRGLLGGSYYASGEEWKAERLSKRVDKARTHPSLGQESLGGLFDYFGYGEVLREEDFF